MYVAKGYVDIKGRLYTPGEIIPEDPNADWHLRAGAIVSYDGEPKEVREPESGAQETIEELPPETTAKPEKRRTTPQEDDGPEEINVMDGIVTKTKGKSKRKGGKADVDLV